MYGQVVGGGNSTSKPSTSQVQNRRLQSAGSDNEVRNPVVDYLLLCAIQ